MRVTAAQLKALAELGLTLEQVASVVSILVPADSPDRIAERREKDKKRKQLTRARVRADAADRPKRPVSLEGKTQEGKKESKVTAPQAPSADKRGSRLPTGWTPKPEALNFALSLGFDRPSYDRHLDEFRDYWRAVAGAKGVKLDWDATWRNRLRKIVEYRNERTVSNGQNQKSGPSPERRAELQRILDATPEELARLRHH